MPKRTEQYFDDRRRRLLQAAERCFMRRGYHATSIEDICKAAKVSVATIYKYFTGKRDIFLATQEEGEKRTIAKQTFDSWPQLKQRYVDAARTLDEPGEKANWRVILELSAEAQFDAELVRMARPRALQLHRHLLEGLRGMASRGEISLPLGVETTARMLQYLVTGLGAARPWIDNRSPQDIAADLARMLDLVVSAKNSSDSRSK